MVPKSLLKSINSCKSFAPTSEMADLERWMVRMGAWVVELECRSEWQASCQ